MKKIAIFLFIMGITNVAIAIPPLPTQQTAVDYKIQTFFKNLKVFESVQNMGIEKVIFLMDDKRNIDFSNVFVFNSREDCYLFSYKHHHLVYIKECSANDRFLIEGIHLKPMVSLDGYMMENINCNIADEMNSYSEFILGKFFAALEWVKDSVNSMQNVVQVTQNDQAIATVVAIPAIVGLAAIVTKIGDVLIARVLFFGNIIWMSVAGTGVAAELTADYLYDNNQICKILVSSQIKNDLITKKK